MAVAVDAAAEREDDRAQVILYRHRRRMPLLALGVGVGVVLALTAWNAPETGPAVVMGVLALVSATLGVIAHRRVWTEDHVITDAEVILERPDGSGARIPLTRLQSATAKGSSVRFVRDDGGILDFNATASTRRVLSILEDVAPWATRREAHDPACST
jgi:hypothetical protein